MAVWAYLQIGSVGSTGSTGCVGIVCSAICAVAAVLAVVAREHLQEDGFVVFDASAHQKICS